MDTQSKGYAEAALESQEKSLERIEKLIAASRPDAVFGEPLTVGESQVITASETITGLGFGFGVGGSLDEEDVGPSGQEPESAGGGSGGGGMSHGRPVAIIRVDAEGVAVEPVVDVTKIALAAFTALGTMFVMFGKMAKGAR